MKMHFDKEIDDRDNMIKSLNDRVEKLRIELKKAVLLLRQKT